jgi:hypothetical protein
MCSIKEILYKELELKANVNLEGVNVNSTIFKHLNLGGKHQKQVHSLFEMINQVGSNYEQYFDVSLSPDFLVQDIFRIEEELLPTFRTKDA